ncbi:MAG: acetyltransferase [Desulfocapsa sp.]|nr:MAG: acetyltransferase [Desulfocapsa sp.]
MKYIDVFNGDADGICALHQLRLEQPHPDSRLITGVKRDITLLDRLTDVGNATITVLDISLDRNRDSLQRILAHNNIVFYVDHHYAGDLPCSDNFTAHIDPDPLTCTSLLINRLLHDSFAAWAVVGAFGDNLDESALQLAQRLGLHTQETERLKETGILLNYNGYGAQLDDLFFAPAELFQKVHSYTDPLIFYAESETLQTLRKGYRDDMQQAQSFAPVFENSSGRIFQLPPEPWARRVAGVFSNTLARQKPALAHALLTANNDGTLRVSVRAPLQNRIGADTLCRQFPTGGGRSAAAGINALPAEQLDIFSQAFSHHFTKA